MATSGISTHVLDTAGGHPVPNMAVTLEQGDGQGGWRAMGRGTTDGDGRLHLPMPAGASLVPGPYRLTFDTRGYFEANRVAAFYPSVAVTFEAAAGETRYHVPLLLSPFGYTTYRGS